MLALFITIFVHLFSVTFRLACLALPSFAFVELCWIFFGDFVLLLLLFCVFCLLHAPRSSLIFFEGPNNPKNMPKLSALKKHFCFHCGREMWKLSTNSGLFSPYYFLVKIGGKWLLRLERMWLAGCLAGELLTYNCGSG